jgi:phosphoribosylanthranilate isomerase
MFVKICGMNARAAVRAAVDAGADAIGFVFSDSPRRVTPLRARELVADVPQQVERIAVTRHPSRELCSEIFEIFEPDCLQTDAEDFASIRLPESCSALPVIRNGRVPPDAPSYERLLFEGSSSGSGETADWLEARGLATQTRLVLAGGLDAGNIVQAIERVRPWGVDVSSGVESSPGVKEPLKIREFVARVRAMERAS